MTKLLAGKLLLGHNRFRISQNEREYISANLAFLLKATIPIGEALKYIGESTKSRPLRLAMEQMQGDIDSGSSLWRALQNSGVFPPQTVALVRMGEESGKLIENLQIAVVQEAKMRTLKSKIRAAAVYPAFVVSLTLVVGLGVAWFLLPRLSDTFDRLDVRLPWISKVMLDAGTLLKLHGWWAVPVSLAVITLGAVVLFGLPMTRSLGQRLLLHTPGVARLTREVELSRFGHLMGSLLGSGLSITQSLDLLGRAATSPAYLTLYAHLREGFDQGYGFRDSLRMYKHVDRLIPLPVQQIMIAGERSGSLAAVLQTIGATYEERADITAGNLEAILEPVLLVVVWLGVMALAIAVILPVYSLVGGLEGR